MTPAGESRTAPSQVFLRPIASPFALGFLGLAGATLTDAGLQLGWFSDLERHQAALIILIVAPIPQLIASIFGFLARDPIAATGMGWLGASWLAYGATLLTTPDGATVGALGVFLLVSAGGLAVSATEAATGKLVPAAVMATTATRFALSGIYELSGANGWQDAAGWVGVALCGLALYAVAALALEDLRDQPVLPTGRRAAGLEALQDGFDAQVSRVANEAGVRRQL